MGNCLLSDSTTYYYGNGHGFWIISFFTNHKYRDLKFLIDFAVPLLKICYTRNCHFLCDFCETLPKDLVFLAKYNPIGYLIDSFNYMFVGAGSFDWITLLISEALLLSH